MIYHINGSKIENIRFKHLDYYDALAEYQRRNQADENTKPWCFIRKGSLVTLCTMIVDGTWVEGWSHKVPQDGPYRLTGNTVALRRAIQATGKDKAWRSAFWDTYRAGQQWLRSKDAPQGIRLVKGASIGGSDVDRGEGKAQASAEGEEDVPSDHQAAQAGDGGSVPAHDGDGSSGACA